MYVQEYKKQANATIRNKSKSSWSNIKHITIYIYSQRQKKGTACFFIHAFPKKKN